jgi:hypothetical protein
MTAPLKAVESADFADTVTLFLAARDRHREHARQAWIGYLVLSFTNEQLLMLADGYLSNVTVADLRRLGLLRGEATA